MYNNIKLATHQQRASDSRWKCDNDAIPNCL